MNFHFSITELSKDHLNGKGIEVLGGIVSPVNDAYPKKSLIPSNHRIRMVELALQDYDFVKCSDWEAKQNVWTRTRAALEYYNKEVVLENTLLKFLIYHLTWHFRSELS